MVNPFPLGAYVDDVQITNNTNNSATESFSGVINVKRRNVQWWEIKFKLITSGQQGVRELEAFADSLDGQFGTFDFHAGNKGKPLKRIRGAATTTATDAGKSKVKVNGITGALSIGDFISFSNHSKVYRVTSYDKATGFADIKPALRKAQKLGDSIKYDNVTFKLRLKRDDVKYKYIDSENILEISFDTREAL